MKTSLQIAAEARSRWPLSAVRIAHRLGVLEIGEASVAVAVASLVCWAMLASFAGDETHAGREATIDELPPEPRLQTSPERELQALRAAEARVLSSYAPTPEAGYARVPIERAANVRLEGRDAAGDPVSLTLEGMDARVVQHELDHLDGVLLLDRTDAESRRQALAQLRPRLVLTSS